MKELVVISGKGGTGKTTVAASLAVLTPDCLLADADVDAPDLHLLLNPRTQEEGEFRSGFTAVRDPGLCIECERCRQICRFGAITEDFSMLDVECEGCGACEQACPTEAISLIEGVSGRWYVSMTPQGPMVHAQLLPGRENSGKLVTLVREKAQEQALARELSTIITDGPPGVGCPLMGAISGAAAVLVVAEPTTSGLHDMQRVLDVCDHFRVRAMACVNKSDLNPEMAARMESACRERGVPVVGRIPYDPQVTEALRAGRPLVSFGSGPASWAVRCLWERAMEALKGSTSFRLLAGAQQAGLGAR